MNTILNQRQGQLLRAHKMRFTSAASGLPFVSP